MTERLTFTSLGRWSDPTRPSTPLSSNIPIEGSDPTHYVFAASDSIGIFELTKSRGESSSRGPVSGLRETLEREGIA